MLIECEYQNTYEGVLLNVKVGQKMLRMIIDYHLEEIKTKYNNIEMKITLFDDKFILILQFKALAFCRKQFYNLDLRIIVLKY